jgi:hypothetical protein
MQQIVPRRYLAKDFDAYRSEMLEHARIFFGNKIKDLSESGLGGLVIDTCAMVGDSLSFYLDHQYNELDASTAVEAKNIQRLARAAGVKLTGASPAFIPEQRFFVKVPAVRTNGVWAPDATLLPTIQAGSVVSDGTVEFVLLEDVNLAAVDVSGGLTATVKIMDRASDGSPRTFSVSATGACTSGRTVEETFSIGSSFVPFRRITLSQRDVSQIVSVIDSMGNVYYEVSALTHDTVYRATHNPTALQDGVELIIDPIPAPYRFTTDYDQLLRQTTLVFGGGSAAALEDDAVPDPSMFAIPFRGRRTFDRVSITPQRLLQTRTLGVAATNVQLIVTYRYGGGLSHNVPAPRVGSIRSAKLKFPNAATPALIAAVKATLATSNDSDASGGDDPLSLDDIRSVIPAARSSQERIVTRDDLVARVYSMSSEFGRVFRASASTDPVNPTSAQLYIVSRDADGHLVTSPDALKRNLVVWLNPYRLIADAIDIRDAQIVNIGVTFEIVVTAGLNKTLVLSRAAGAIAQLLSQDRLAIDQSISIDALKNAVFSITGVAAISSLSFTSMSGTIGTRQYPGQVFDVNAQTYNGFLVPPRGGIFELRYADFDIVGRTL